MNKILVAITGLAIIAAAAVGGFFLQQKFSTEEQVTAAAPHSSRSAISVIGKPRPDFSLPDLEGTLRSASEWDGKIRLVNFWATWCPPCVREMPAFIEMQEQYKDKDFVVIGIALDSKDRVDDFINNLLDINYPILNGEAATELTTLYGNRLGVLPFSVFIGKDNKIISTHNGEITADTIKSVLLSQNVK